MNTDTSAHLYELKDYPKVAQSKKKKVSINNQFEYDVVTGER